MPKSSWSSRFLCFLAGEGAMEPRDDGWRRRVRASQPGTGGRGCVLDSCRSQTTPVCYCQASQTLKLPHTASDDSECGISGALMIRIELFHSGSSSGTRGKSMTRDAGHGHSSNPSTGTRARQRRYERCFRDRDRVSDSTTVSVLATAIHMPKPSKPRICICPTATFRMPACSLRGQPRNLSFFP